MNILLLSDTHGEQKRTQAICREHPAMDLYVHLGDIGFDPSLLEGFHIVQGNHDADAWCLRQEEILEISGHRILMIHGHQMEMKAAMQLKEYHEEDAFHYFMECIEQKIAEYALSLNCDTVFHGHTHMRCDRMINGVRIINPGSLLFNRSEMKCSYACVRVLPRKISCRFTLVDIAE